ncbi:copper chaperone PCu(A)C [Halopseudomonas pelagia]|uniref:copper chaperone PCu(A)C n=1 Tax=Halopseudomonas pelagia TaxID=553151 RepID=UPI00039C529F|nr:copper chaperone PCu(A)C [Halopseudomonas pelagia]|tara:strand:+ start:1060 stop:1545 length:486 start_codon:yes stop_codon:yes gene_type:complete
MTLKPRTLALCATLLGTLFAGQSFAHEYDIADLHIIHPWARALPPVAPTGAAYMIIENRGERADTLTDVRTPVAGHAEIHEHIHQDGLMKMQQVENLILPAGESVSFKPGGYHIMLFNLKQPLTAGERFPLTLYFQQAGQVDVEIAIEEDAPAVEKSGHHH